MKNLKAHHVALIVFITFIVCLAAYQAIIMLWTAEGCILKYAKNTTIMGVDYLKIIVTVILAAVGWVIAHYFTDRRQASAKRRDIVTEHLVKAYRVLAYDIQQLESPLERLEKLQVVICDIQLFGSVEQIELVKDLISGLVNSGDFSLDPLINSLRGDLRKQLNLSVVSGNVKWVRPEASTKQ